MAAFAGITGAVTSWTNNTQIIATGSEPAEFDLTMEALEFDTTTFSAAGISTWLKGLSQWSGTIRSQFKTAQTGDTGLVTFSAGYVTNLNRWSLAVAVAALETTAFGDTVRSYIPGKYSWGGDFGGWQDGTTPLTMPGNSSEPATGTFKLREAGATDDTLSGSIFTTLANATVNANSAEPTAVSYTYRGSGALTQSTPSAGTTILATGAQPIPTAGTLTLTAISGQTFAGTAFPTAIRIVVPVNGLATSEVDFRGTGALTIG